MEMLKPVVPFLLQSTASMGGFATGLAVSQGIGATLRITCATPILGSLGGMAGVGLASVMGGQMSLLCAAAYDSPPKNVDGLLKLMPPLDTRRVVLDALLGSFAFKLVGGSFRTVMPSDLTKVGALARESIPAAGMQYAGEEKRRELIRMFRRDGCHHCGTKKGMVIGDHMPPNKHVQEKAEAAISQAVDALSRYSGFRKFFDIVGIGQIARIQQRYYPQCASCSQKQAVAVRNGRSHSVFHRVLHGGGRGSGWHYVGVWIGAGHGVVQEKKVKRRPYY